MEHPTAVLYDEQKPILVSRSTLVRVIAGPDAGRSQPLSHHPVRVGTAPDNELVLTDGHVSRRHLEFRVHDHGYLVRDMGSTNGVYFRNARIQEAVLGPASEVRLGSTVLRLEVGPEEAQEVAPRESFGGLVGASAAMQGVYGLLAAVAPTDTTVLIEGETGTGKEVVAQAIHGESPRAKAPFCVIDCGSISSTLIESELFGHERGAFTGAVRDRSGIFERAHGGTVFLDEVGEIPLPLQTRLLRVLEQREVRRVGGNVPRRVDVRLLAATNRILSEEVRAGRFREDLYYRLAVIRIVVAPLRQRREDIPLLARHFLWQAGSVDPDAVLTPEMMNLLLSRMWRGNVRELRNAIERAVVLSGDAKLRFPDEDLPPPEAEAAEPRSEIARQPSGSDWLSRALPAEYLDRPFKDARDDIVHAFEAVYLKKLIEAHGRNLSRIAREAGVDRQIIRRMLHRHGLGE
jgi:DNA-binding NtrC family response regulator